MLVDALYSTDVEESNDGISLQCIEADGPNAIHQKAGEFGASIARELQRIVTSGSANSTTGHSRNIEFLKDADDSRYERNLQSMTGEFGAINACDA